MAKTIPDDLVPIVEALGVDWPDINEDDVYNLGSDFSNFGMSLFDFSTEVTRALKQLSSDNSGATLDALVQHWAKIDTDFIEPVVDLLDKMLTLALVASDLIVTYKTELEIHLALEGGAVAFMIANSGDTLGLSDLAAAGARQAIVKWVEHRAEQAVTDLTSKFLNKLESEINEPISDAVGRASNLLAGKAYAKLAKEIPAGNLSTLQRDLVVSSTAIATATKAIDQSFTTVTKGVTTVVDEVHEKSFTTTTKTSTDSRLRIAVQSELEMLMPEVTNAVQQLCCALIEHATGIADLFHEQIIEADQNLFSGNPSVPGNMA